MTVVYDYVGAVGTVNIADNAVTDAKIAAHTSTKITITAKGQLNSQIMYKDATNVPSADATHDLGSLGARFRDVFASGAYKMGATPLQIQEVDANTATLVNSVGARKTWLVSGIRASSLAQEDGTVLIGLGASAIDLKGSQGVVVTNLKLGGAMDANGNDINKIRVAYISGTDNNNLKIVGGGATAPHQHIHFVSDYTKQVGATDVTVFSGYNSEILQFVWVSKWSGTQREILKLDGNKLNIFHGGDSVPNVLIANGGPGNNFKQGFGIGGYWDGSNWITTGDGANNGALLLIGSTGAAFGIYRIGSTGGANQIITEANIGNYEVIRFDSTGITFKGTVNITDGKNIALATTTGTKIGTATNQKLGFWNATPVVQPTGIADADGTLADITTKFNSLLSKLETIGILAVA